MSMAAGNADSTILQYASFAFADDFPVCWAGEFRVPVPGPAP